MIFRLTLNRHRQAVNLSFFDSAGEDMQSLDTMSTEARYICAAAGIIFLLDPLQIDAIRQQVPVSMQPTRDVKADPVNIVERLRELFERQHSLKATKKVKTPVAFVLSKIDTLFSILDPSSGLRGAGEHFGHFNLRDSQSIHTEIRTYLDSWMGAGFSNRVDSDFVNYRFFGVSSLGRAPTRQGRVDSIAPIRVEDPFFWLLHQFGLIEGRK